MNKKLKLGAAALILLLVLAVGYSYFHVSGKEIASFAAIDENCEVEIVRYDALDVHQPLREYTLAGPQIKELKGFLEGSSYTRRLTFLDKVSYHTPVSYSIYVYFDERQKVLYLGCLGEDHLFVSSSFEEKDYYDLKINRKGWRDMLEKILESAQLQSA